MKYVTYYETEEVVPDKDHGNDFSDMHTEQQKKTDYIERYHFVSFYGKAENTPKYSICRKNKEKIYLEKSSSQNGLFWRECEEISQEEARQMKTGDLGWMKNDTRYLVRDFYLQMTINDLRYDYYETYDRQEYVYQRNDRIVFNRNIKRIRGDYVLDILPEGFVQIRLRRAKTIPRVIQNMMQGLEFTEEVPVYV